MTDSDASILLREIGEWAAATGRTPAELGMVVLNHAGFVPLLRKRGTLKPETAVKLRGFMRLFGTAERLPGNVFARLLSDARAGAPWTPDRHRSLMIRYGFMDLVEPAGPLPDAESKPRVSAAVIRAAKIDGRDLPTFVTALIDMGLDCWRDDRVMHGEAVA